MTVNLTQAQIKTPVDKVYIGEFTIDGTIVNDKLTLVDNKFKKGMLYEKTKGWVKTNFTFGGDYIIYNEGKSIEINSEFATEIVYKLLVEFKDGKFKYTYTDNTNCSDAVIKKYLKPTVEDLAKYLKQGKYDQIK
jgi:hypothetical protein